MYDDELIEIHTTGDSFSAFASAVANLIRDTRQEQASLLIRARCGDTKAKKTLWEQASKLVLFVHAKMKRQGKLPTVAYDDNDAIQEANLAVGEALLRWDPARGTLATWLVPHIRGTLLNYANTHLNAGIGSKHVSVIRVGLDEQVDSEEVSSAQDEPGMEQSVGITREESLTYSEEVIPSQVESLSASQVERAIDSMTYPHNNISHEHYIMGLSVAEIAENRGVTPQTIRRYLSESNVYLRGKLFQSRR
jgi:RNA polymerase sigma factor (sigma-70 family)